MKCTSLHSVLFSIHKDKSVRKLTLFPSAGMELHCMHTSFHSCGQITPNLVMAAKIGSDSLTNVFVCTQQK